MKLQTLKGNIVQLFNRLKVVIDNYINKKKLNLKTFRNTLIFALAIICLIFSIGIVYKLIKVLILNGHIIDGSDISFEKISSIGTFLNGTFLPLITLTTGCFIALDIFIKRDQLENDKNINTIKEWNDHSIKMIEKLEKKLKQNYFVIEEQQKEIDFSKPLKINEIKMFHYIIDILKKDIELKSEKSCKEVLRILKNLYNDYAFIMAMIYECPEKDIEEKRLHMERLLNYVSYEGGDTFMQLSLLFFILNDIFQIDETLLYKDKVILLNPPELVMEVAKQFLLDTLWQNKYYEYLKYKSLFWN